MQELPLSTVDDRYPQPVTSAHLFFTYTSEEPLKSLAYEAQNGPEMNQIWNSTGYCAGKNNLVSPRTEAK